MSSHALQLTLQLKVYHRWAMLSLTPEWQCQKTERLHCPHNCHPHGGWVTESILKPPWRTVLYGQVCSHLIPWRLLLTQSNAFQFSMWDNAKIALSLGIQSYWSGPHLIGPMPTEVHPNGIPIGSRLSPNKYTQRDALHILWHNII